MAGGNNAPMSILTIATQNASKVLTPGIISFAKIITTINKMPNGIVIQ